MRGAKEKVIVDLYGGDDKEMYEQLDMFSLMKSQDKEKYCFDNDINEIHEKLINIANKHGTPIEEDEFSIWPHVPQYGYRLWLEMQITRDNLQDNGFMRDIKELIHFAKERNIELSCMVGACFFYGTEHTTGLPFTTMFTDKKRQKIK